MENSVKKMLRLTDKNLKMTGVSHETIQNQPHLVIEASLSPSPSVCTNLRFFCKRCTRKAYHYQKWKEKSTGSI